MADSPEVSRSSQILNVGDTVSAGFRLYQAKSSDYLKLAFIGTLWILLPYAATIALILFFIVVRNYYALLGLLIPAVIVLAFYCAAQFAAHIAAIARHSFGELSSQSESVDAALRYTRSRKWSFVWAGVLISLIYMGILVPFYILLGILLVSMFASVGGLQAITGGGIDPTNVNAGGVLLALLAFLVLLCGFLVVMLWVGARLFSYELPLAVEPGVTGSQTIGRVWQLTKGSAWRIVLILIVAGLVTLPLQFLSSIISNMLDKSIQGFAPVNTPTYQVLSALIGAVVGLLVSIIVLPLWQVIKSVVYYDLRNRREGFGLQLRDRDTPA
jgi:hypothetical protein